MTTEGPLADFLAFLEDITQERPVLQGNVIRAGLPGQRDIDLSQAPQGYALFFTQVGEEAREVLFRFGDQPGPGSLTLVAAAGLERVSLVLQSEPLPLLALDLQHATQRVVVSDLRAERIEVHGGPVWFEVPAERITRLLLTDSILEGTEGLHLDGLRLGGSIGIARLQVRAARTYVLPELDLHHQAELHLGEVVSGGDNPSDAVTIFVRSASNLSVRSFTDGSSVTLSGGTLSLGQTPADATLMLTVMGTGRLDLSGASERMRVLPESEGAIVLDLHGVAIAAEGAAIVRLHEGALLSGKPGEPFVLQGVFGAERAEMEHVDIYSLDILDVARLDGIERFQPAIPRSKEARSKERTMRLGRGNRAHFWARMAALLKESHASGAVQSEVRYAAALARRMAVPWGRERTFLTLYAAVGYGERVRRPLYWLLALSLLLTVWFEASGSSSLDLSQTPAFLQTWSDIVLSPLAFFVRFTEGPVMVNGIQEKALLVFRVVGIILLLFAALAVRRVTKAE